MSEVVNPDMNPSPYLFDDSAQPAHTPTNAGAAEASQKTEDDWQTVNFPGALDVDTIPLHSSTPIPANSTPPNTDPAIGNPGQEMSRLHQENAELRVQVAQLAEDLSQAQIELQLEVARFYCKEAEAEATQERDRLTEALQEQETHVQQLNQKLQTAQETIQQQQTEIQSLTEQIEQGQQRIAQLERECALTQQRYNEQLQLVSQAENACQDLRMRLHRQQQQTLQFKAALEKSIEMTAVLTPTQTEPAAIAGNPLIAGKDENPFLPKAQPVQPWSTGTDAPTHAQSATKQRSSGLPSLLAKLAKQPLAAPKPLAMPPAEQPPTPPPTIVVPSDAVTPIAAQPEPVAELPQLDAASKNILEFLFPTSAAPAIANSTPAANPIFDLSPFIEAGEVDANSLSQPHDSTPTETVVHQTVESMPAAPPPTKQPSGDGLWADLARLIEPDLTMNESATASAQTPNQPEAAPPSHSDQIAELPQPLPTQPKAAKSLSQISFFLKNQQEPESSSAEESRVISQNPFPSFTLHSSTELPAEAAVVLTSVNSLDTPVLTTSPSPILYPTRPAKKIASMAAVDLPSFPRG